MCYISGMACDPESVCQPLNVHPEQVEVKDSCVQYCCINWKILYASLESNYQPPVTFMVIQKAYKRLFPNNHHDQCAPSACSRCEQRRQWYWQLSSHIFLPSSSAEKLAFFLHHGLNTVVLVKKRTALP
ncbi:Argonaute [Melia azedarach]|uniref:Argonaute n=1 Tax=Melia azedarach TaxID=155640 RepID=A0ACC1XQJ5_MELAZ|nr:Argonaute [Melia azedarach]